VSTDTIAGILANPSGFYVNVHTTTNSFGEIRGQLVCAPTIVANVVSAGLIGANQVPAVTTSGAGTVALTMDATAGTIAGQWNLAGLSSNATFGHIHAGDAGTNGGVIVDFSSSIPAAGGQFSSQKTGVSASVIDAVLYAPFGYYVNVHTASNGSGEVRGQLAAPRSLLPSAPKVVAGG
jgi:hypothetical protein